MKVHLIEKRIALAGTDTLSLGSVSNRRIVIVFGAIDYNTNIQEKSFMILGVRISEEWDIQDEHKLRYSTNISGEILKYVLIYIMFMTILFVCKLKWNSKVRGKVKQYRIWVQSLARAGIYLNDNNAKTGLWNVSLGSLRFLFMSSVFFPLQINFIVFVLYPISAFDIFYSFFLFLNQKK